VGFRPAQVGIAEDAVEWCGSAILVGNCGMEITKCQSVIEEVYLVRKRVRMVKRGKGIEEGDGVMLSWVG
jgi:hypothetical protein